MRICTILEPLRLAKFCEFVDARLCWLFGWLLLELRCSCLAEAAIVRELGIARDDVFPLESQGVGRATRRSIFQPCVCAVLKCTSTKKWRRWWVMPCLKLHAHSNQGLQITFALASINSPGPEFASLFWGAGGILGDRRQTALIHWTFCSKSFRIRLY